MSKRLIIATDKMGFEHLDSIKSIDRTCLACSQPRLEYQATHKVSWNYSSGVIREHRTRLCDHQMCPKHPPPPQSNKKLVKMFNIFIMF